MKKLQISKQPISPDAQQLTIKGFLDAYTYTQLEQTIKELFDTKVYKIVFDLSELEYISSAGASVFIGAHGIATEHDGAIVLLKPSKNVKQVLSLLGLNNIFTITQTRQEALKVLK
ncbi:MAG: STAS domain-containing protein [Planctomycetes bacterium]|nr:STAS domain-containing protein [Planctomycetota bacterium]